MSMTIREMIDALEDAANTLESGEDTEVRMAYQPNYPLQAHVRGVVTSLQINDDTEDPEDEDDVKPMVWIVESGQVYNSPYAPRGVFTR